MGGDYPDGQQPAQGLSVAWMMAHITYLSDAGLEAKFGRKRRNLEAKEHFGVEFEVESYTPVSGAGVCFEV